jgi:proteasome accessory factor C
MPGIATKKAKRMMETANAIFRNQGHAVSELASMLNVSEKELLETLEMLSLCGIPPYGPGDLFDIYIEDGCVFIQHPYGFFDRPVQFSPTEGMALLVAGRAAGQVNPALDSALKKIQAALKPEKASEIARLSEQVDLTPETGATRPILEILKKAAGIKKIEMEYYTAGRSAMSHRTVHPYGLIYNVDRWLLVGYCESRRGVRVFRIDRIKTARLTGERFAMPRDFHLSDFRKRELFRSIERPNKVVLRFDRNLAVWAGERWPGHAKFNNDNSVDVEFHIDRLESFVSTVMTFGDSARVVDPPELKELMAKAALRTLSLYKKA